jgi:hypothetical protein
MEDDILKSQNLIFGYNIFSVEIGMLFSKTFDYTALRSLVISTYMSELEPW